MKFNIKINSLLRITSLFLLCLLIFLIIKIFDARGRNKEYKQLLKQQEQLIRQHNNTIQYKDSLLNLKPDTIEVLDTVYYETQVIQKCKPDTITIPVKSSSNSRIDTYYLDNGTVIKLFVIANQQMGI